MDIVQFKPSLLKYEPPQLVIEKSQEKKMESPSAVTELSPLTMEYPDFANKLFVAEREKREGIRETLDIIFPPRKFEDEGCLWVQRVASDPATSVDVINLQEQLDDKCLKQKAQETGVCAIRREIYDQFFDELIRQLTISCPERGLLLSKIRDEVRMTLAAYETLFASSLAYGVRKALLMKKNELDAVETEQKIECEETELNDEIVELTEKCEMIKRDVEEKQTIYDNHHIEEMQTITELNKQFKDQLEKIIFNTGYF